MSNHNVQFQRPAPVRLWPWVLGGVLLGVLGGFVLWAYLEPMPEYVTPEPVTLGPDSPLYGPLK